MNLVADMLSRARYFDEEKMMAHGENKDFTDCELKNRVSLLKIVFLNTFRVILVFPVSECSSLAKTLEQGMV